MIRVKYMSKFIKKDLENPEFADHKRFCRSCGRQTFRWTCCGERTSRVKMKLIVKRINFIQREKERGHYSDFLLFHFYVIQSQKLRKMRQELWHSNPSCSLSSILLRITFFSIELALNHPKASITNSLFADLRNIIIEN